MMNKVILSRGLKREAQASELAKSGRIHCHSHSDEYQIPEFRKCHHQQLDSA